MVYIWTAFFSLLPISELRGGIPFAMVNGVPWFIAWPFAAGVNALAAPLCWLFLSSVHRLLYGRQVVTAAEGTMAESSGGFSWYRGLFDHFVDRARHKLHGAVEKWGVLGIAVFVAIPLPLTGAWTGTLGAWVLGLSRRKTLLAVILGVAAAGAMVTAVVSLGISALRIFIKEEI